MLFLLASLASSVLAEDETTTFFSFSRRVQTCDLQDRPLEQATSKVIWSYNSQDPVDENSILQHEERGIKSIRFFNEDSAPANLPSDAQFTDITLNNVNIKFDNPQFGPKTQYWCSAYKISDVFTTKRQIIRVEPVIDSRNYNNVHHILMYQCVWLNDTTDVPYQGGCYQQGVPSGIWFCNGEELLAGWAVGGFPVNFPPHIGRPMQGKDIYIIMETHYDNPQELDITDSSGIRLWHTGQLRTYDSGLMVVGYAVDSQFTIPPGQSAYPYNAYCPEECTTLNIPPAGINVTGVNLHTHYAGKTAIFRHFRNGTELPPLLSEPYYDFNYQEITQLAAERLVLPGDSFQVQCVYDTTGRTTDTPMGASTLEEMCRGSLSYYPKLPATSERCTYANYTGKTPNTGQTISCGALQITNWTGPWEIPAYQPPLCIYTGPPNNASTTPILITKEQFNRSKYLNNITLDQEGKYKLYWNLDKENFLFHAAVEVKTTGWVGLGVSPGGMAGADVLIAWVKDGQVYFGDRFATQQAMPGLDPLQDYYDISGGQYTEVTESAKLSTTTIVGITAGGVIFLVVIVFFISRVCNKKPTDMDTALTRDTYGGTSSDEGDDTMQQSNSQKKEAVRL